MAVADVYDALTSRRVYKDAMRHEQAIAIIVGRNAVIAFRQTPSLQASYTPVNWHSTCHAKRFFESWIVSGSRGSRKLFVRTAMRVRCCDCGPDASRMGGNLGNRDFCAGGFSPSEGAGLRSPCAKRQESEGQL